MSSFVGQNRRFVLVLVLVVVLALALALLAAGCGAGAPARGTTPASSASATTPPSTTPPRAPTTTTTPAGQPAHLAQLSPAGQHTCARWSDGHVECWGEGSRGQLGDGSSVARPTPARVPNIDQAIRLCTGDMYSCVLDRGGTVECWGANGSGQLGDGSPSPREPRSKAAPVVDLSDVVLLACGDLHACARTRNGGVRCWGENDHGAAGAGDPGPTARPSAPIAGLGDVVQLSLGGSHSCALLRDGSVRCWGNNARGQLGDGTTTSSPTPKPVAGLPPIAEVAASDRSTCARTSAGAVWCWGANNHGQLGDGTLVDHTKPVLVAGLPAAPAPAIEQLSGGDMHVCARAKTDVYCWGSNMGGQIGDGTRTDRPSPVKISGVSGATSVIAGWAHTCVLLAGASGDAAACWGHNQHGQLGDGTTVRRLAPTPVVFAAAPPAATSSSATP